MEDIKGIKQQVQAAARGVVKKAPSTKKIVPKAKKAPVPTHDSDEDDSEVEEVEDFDDDEEPVVGSASAAQTAQELLATAVQVAVTHKAVAMFVVASLAIYFQGEQMSV